MATWLVVTVWILWLIWTFVEVISLVAMHKHNNNDLNVALVGRMYYGPIAKTTSIIYVVLTVAWFCYNLV